MYSKLKTIVTLSALGVIVPFLGIPLVWKTWLSALIALVVGILAYRLLQQNTTSKSPSNNSYDGDPPYVENNPQTDTSTVENRDEA